MMIDAYFFNVFLKKNDGIARRFVFENGYKPAVTKTGNVWEGETVRAGLCGGFTWIAASLRSSQFRFFLRRFRINNHATTVNCTYFLERNAGFKIHATIYQE